MSVWDGPETRQSGRVRPLARARTTREAPDHMGTGTPRCPIAGAEEREIEDKTRAETVRREARYFRDHEKHMDYRTAPKDGVPIGSGAMESQCSQNQNRFKRRGQFWSKGGFASFVAAYVWYVNDELKYLYRQAS